MKRMFLVRRKRCGQKTNHRWWYISCQQHSRRIKTTTDCICCRISVLWFSFCARLYYSWFASSVKFAVAVFLEHLWNAWFPPLQMVMRFIARGSFICVLSSFICVCCLPYLSPLLDTQLIPAYLISKLKSCCKTCLSVFWNGKLLQLLALVDLLFSHIEYLAENGEHTSSWASCECYISFLTYITKNE